MWLIGLRLLSELVYFKSVLSGWVCPVLYKMVFKHADVLARGDGKQLHTKADVIAGIKSKAHEMGDKKARQPRSHSIERKTDPKL